MQAYRLFDFGLLGICCRPSHISTGLVSLLRYW